MAVIPAQAQEQAATEAPPRAEKERKDLGPGSLAGNLTADPALRYTPNGRAVASLRVAVTPRVKDAKSGQWKDGPAQFFDVTAWGQLAENCVQYLAKGHRIVADGQWESRSWEDTEGVIQERVGLVARDLGPSMLFHGAQLVKAERRHG